MRTALLFQEGNFVGREYFARLSEAGWRPHRVATVGRMKPESVAREVARTNGLWRPPHVPADAVDQRFASASDPALAAWMRLEEIDVAIQGGVGILRGDALVAPRMGWLNVHPGALPAYRGSACPEWAVLNGDPVVATAHMIDHGLDTGPVVCAGRYEPPAGAGYNEFRAGLYRHCAAVLVAALERLAAEGLCAARPQSDEGAVLRPPMDEATLERVVAMFPLSSALEGISA